MLQFATNEHLKTLLNFLVQISLVIATMSMTEYGVRQLVILFLTRWNNCLDSKSWAVCYCFSLSWKSFPQSVWGKKSLGWFSEAVMVQCSRIVESLNSSTLHCIYRSWTLDSVTHDHVWLTPKTQTAFPNHWVNIQKKFRCLGEHWLLELHFWYKEL